MENLLKRQKKVLVHVLEANDVDYFKKYPVDETGCIAISPGGVGRGNLAEAPRLTSEAKRQKKGKLFRTSYVIYPRGSGKLLTRNDKDIPAVNMELIKELIKIQAMRAYTGKQPTSFISYIILGGIVMVGLKVFGMI